MSEPTLDIDSDSTALLVQDMQRDNLHHEGANKDSGVPEHADEQNIYEHIGALMDAARERDIPVIHIHYIAEEDAAGLAQNAAIFSDIAADEVCVRGSWGAQPMDGMEPQEDDVVVEKMRVDGFRGTNLDNLLRGFDVDSFVLTGVFTNFSIESTARSGADLGYDVTVVEDATASFSEEWQNAALNYTLTQMTDIESTEDVLAALTE
ncbi:cysteine hydrolase family protein [Haloferax marisrubri]|uniref:Isochorismatase n=1 Tax=Haloferax marisrubri TaxID=1544719 RepID=A0A2P4NM93_9EURY|nr:cysteine hydrolase [Haloferax marisrubri]POG54283.1 isochorismatase [Haloferax marisrubri]